MSNLLVRNIPDDLYEALRDQAKRDGRSLSAEVVDILRRELANPPLSRAEIRARIERRRKTWGVPERSGAELVREDRDHDDRS